MRVFIAEKPSVAKAIAEILGATNKKDGYIECGSDYVTGVLVTCMSRPNRMCIHQIMCRAMRAAKNLARR